MLLSFAITNFRSIRERTVLSMLKAGLSGLSQNYVKCDNGKQVLRSAVIYGPNASGKSNFICGFKALEYLVLESTSNKPDQKISPYEPYRLDKECLNKPVVFEIIFIAENKQYEYTVSFTSKRVELEELYYYPTNTRSLLFSRAADKEMKFGDYYKGIKKTIEKLLLPNQLFLSKAAENNAESVLGAYSFFDNALSAFLTTEGAMEQRIASKFYGKLLAEDSSSKFAKLFNAFICAVDTGVKKVTAKEAEWKEGMFPGIPEEIKKQIQEDYKYEIKTYHPIFEDGKEVGIEPFDVSDESAGTRSLLFIGGIIIEALINGRLLVVDEFEKSLHPFITRFLIKLFHNPDINKNGAQLLFATHDITQLSNDYFRRDQVWFTTKDGYGVTDLKRCSDIEGLRMGTPVDKWYAAGKLGGVPNIDDVEFLIEMQKDEPVESE